MLTEKNIAFICEQIEQGVPQEAAAGALGIPKRTFDNWLKWGRGEEGEGEYREVYVDLADAVYKARCRLHASRAVRAYAKSEEDPAMLRFLLERRFPEEWAEPARGSNVNIQVNLVASEEWQDLETRLLGALQAHPEALADVLQALAQEDVVDGEAVEVAEIAAA